MAISVTVVTNPKIIPVGTTQRALEEEMRQSYGYCTT